MNIFLCQCSILYLYQCSVNILLCILLCQKYTQHVFYNVESVTLNHNLNNKDTQICFKSKIFNQMIGKNRSVKIYNFYLISDIYRKKRTQKLSCTYASVRHFFWHVRARTSLEKNSAGPKYQCFYSIFFSQQRYLYNPSFLSIWYF